MCLLICYLGFALNNPFRSISISSATSSLETRNPFLDRTESKRSTSCAVDADPLKSISLHRKLPATSLEGRPVQCSKQDARTMGFLNESVQNSMESNDANVSKSAYQNHKHSSFSKEYKKVMLKDNFKGKSRDGVHNRERRSRMHVDCIDLLDVTAMYGSGIFHHDGPFDACNPYRNKNSQKDPLFAFPKNSTSMSLTKLESENSGFPIDKYFGHRDVEAYNEFSPSAFYSRKKCSLDSSKSFTCESTQKVELPHSSETLGFSTSTFTEGSYSTSIAIQHPILLSDKDKNMRDNKFSRVRAHSNTDNNNLNCGNNFIQYISGVKKDS
ncbi:hypothetical protein PCANB_002877 [Pneumocystis canis]|nr:hypothetical protein PCK1_002844 [Pneumocystis canis]KAG5438388.1 hypothetical protein PCANB_002877 [Pneumocystis canis]